MNRKTTLEVQLLPCKQHRHRVRSIKLGRYITQVIDGRYADSAAINKIIQRFPKDSVIRYKQDHVEIKSFMTGKKSFHYKIKTYKGEDLSL